MEVEAVNEVSQRKYTGVKENTGRRMHPVKEIERDA